MHMEGAHWAGALEDPQFLERIFDLASIPSTDSRFQNAAGDIWQHRVSNPSDWDDDWVFSDERFNLLRGDDESFLRFLCETIHPVVRRDVTQSERLLQAYNDCLRTVGFELVEKMRLAGKPVYVGRRVAAGRPGVATARAALARADAGHVARQITRMETAVENDPALAIGTAKELVETCCRTILTDRKVPLRRSASMLDLVKETVKELQLTPDDIPDKAKASQTIKRLLSNLASITQGIAELRNAYGTGHGQLASAKGLEPRHAKLAVGAASTLAVFLEETHRTRAKPS